MHGYLIIISIVLDLLDLLDLIIVAQQFAPSGE
jgi:hypothetical protein